MTQRTYLDGNSIGHAASARKGKRLVAGAQETTAIYGALQTIRKLMEGRAFSKPVVLWDGRSWRRDRFADYKANRVATPELVAERDRYKAQKKQLVRGLHLIGVGQLIAANMEADDLAALMTRRALSRGESVALITGDKDWLQLVQPGVVWVDHKLDRKCTAMTFQEFTGYRTPEAFVHSKALQGDTGDNVPGCGGIGEKGAAEMLSIFSSVDEFLSLPYDTACARWGRPQGLEAKYKRLHQDPETQAKFRRGLELMDLNHPSIPAPIGLRATRATVDLAGFQAFCAELSFSSILRDVNTWLKPFIQAQEEVQ